jgi:ATP phosphoribosyltransferase
VETALDRFGAVSATGEDVDPHGFVALHCARGKVAELAGWLLEKGAERVSVAALEQAFSARNALYEALEQRIGAGQG